MLDTMGVPSYAWCRQIDGKGSLISSVPRGYPVLLFAPVFICALLFSTVCSCVLLCATGLS